jgi:hypothetical protein
MSGASSAASIGLMELFVYPSAQGAGPPSTGSGYDLCYLGATTSVNNNAGTPDSTIWPGGYL